MTLMPHDPDPARKRKKRLREWLVNVEALGLSRASDNSPCPTQICCKPVPHPHLISDDGKPVLAPHSRMPIISFWRQVTNLVVDILHGMYIPASAAHHPAQPDPEAMLPGALSSEGVDPSWVGDLDRNHQSTQRCAFPPPGWGPTPLTPYCLSPHQAGALPVRG